TDADRLIDISQLAFQRLPETGCAQPGCGGGESPPRWADPTHRSGPVTGAPLPRQRFTPWAVWGARFMTTMPKTLRYTPQLIISSACLLFINFYSSILFFQTPYIGFMFDPATGRVEKLFQRPEGSDLLLVGDMLIRVN